ncbi:MAG TPA: SRPBCC family protein [Ktedonobacterales bacterium]
MPITACPATRVAAPVEYVWELLSDLRLYDLWWDARMRRIAPEGAAAPGQLAYATTRGLGRTWDVSFKVNEVDPVKHRVRIDAALPLGVVNHATITATPIDEISSHLAFG